MHRAASRAQSGAILLAVLVMLALVALVGSSVTLDNAGQHQRDDEEELLFVGEQYRQAIESYLRASPNGIRAWPTKLEDLIADNRFPQPRRHLRKLFRDPMAPGKDWFLIKIGPAIVGVHSQSTGVPFRTAGFTGPELNFANAHTYQDWVFSVSAQAPAAAVGGTPANASPKAPVAGPPSKSPFAPH